MQLAVHSLPWLCQEREVIGPQEGRWGGEQQFQEAWGGAQRGSWHVLGHLLQAVLGCLVCVSGVWKVRKSATHEPAWAQLSAVTQLRPISSTHSSDLSSNPAEGEERERESHLESPPVL